MPIAFWGFLADPGSPTPKQGWDIIEVSLKVEP